jgi:hypothetical protein
MHILDELLWPMDCIVAAELVEKAGGPWRCSANGLEAGGNNKALGLLNAKQKKPVARASF